jgi:hypothetical protein
MLNMKHDDCPSNEWIVDLAILEDQLIDWGLICTLEYKPTQEDMDAYDSWDGLMSDEEMDERDAADAEMMEEFCANEDNFSAYMEDADVIDAVDENEMSDEDHELHAEMTADMDGKFDNLCAYTPSEEEHNEIVEGYCPPPTSELGTDGVNKIWFPKNTPIEDINIDELQ